MTVVFESSERRDINDTPVTQFNQTREDQPISKRIFEKVNQPISIKPTQLKSRHHRKCHHSEKPCGQSLTKNI